MRITPNMRRNVLLLAISTLLLVGCTTVAISPSPTPVPTGTPITAEIWTSLPPLPTPRTAVSVGVLEGKIYVVGGLDELGRASAKVEVYDPDTSQWDVASSLPKDLHHASAVTLARSGGDRLYVIGGFEGRRARPSESVYEYDPRQGSWRASIPVARGALSAAAFGDLIYVIGGVDEKTVSSRIDVYNPATDSWAEGPAMRTPRSHLRAVTVGPLIYLIGGKGKTGGTSLDLVEILDPTTGGWATIQNLRVARSSLGALEAEGLLYVLGGEDIDKALQSAEVFDPAIAQWQTFPSLPSPIHGGATVALSGRIFTIGGSVGPGFSAIDDSYTIALD